MAERSGNAEQPNGRTGSRLAHAGMWVVLFSSFGLSANTWVALARLAGFDGWIGPFGWHWLPLPWLMPSAVDGYIVVALAVWMWPSASEETRAFARKNTYAGASIGIAAQSAYHGLVVWAATHEQWQAALATVVGALPPAVAAFAVHMRTLIVRRRSTVRPTFVAPPIGTSAQVVAPIAVRTIARDKPNTPVRAERTSEHAAAANTPNGEQNVRPITSARHAPKPRTPNGANTEQGDVTANMEAIKRHFPNWEAAMPSARKIGKLIGVAPSTGLTYQRRLAAEIAARENVS